MVSTLIEMIPLDELVARCRTESDRPALQRDTRFCLELFRRAIAADDSAAWTAMYAQYHALVRYWLGRTADPDDLVQETFAKFKQMVTAERLSSGTFPTLARLLAYLRSIAISHRINQDRRAERERRALNAWVAERTIAIGGSDLELVQRRELAEYVHSLIPDEREWLVIRLSFEYGFSPREIASSNPGLFADPGHVSRIKERVLKRLRNDLRLRSYLEC